MTFYDLNKEQLLTLKQDMLREVYKLNEEKLTALLQSADQIVSYDSIEREYGSVEYVKEDFQNTEEPTYRPEFQTRRDKLMFDLFERVSVLTDLNIYNIQSNYGSKDTRFKCLYNDFNVEHGFINSVLCHDGRNFDFDMPNMYHMEVRVDIMPNGYSGICHIYSTTTKTNLTLTTDKKICYHPMTDNQIAALIVYYDNLIQERMEQILLAANNRPLNEMQDHVVELVSNYLEENHPSYKAELCKGRRQCDGPTEYYAIVISYKGDSLGQSGLIRLHQNEFKEFRADFSRPLCGNWSVQFNECDADETIISEVKDIMQGR